MRALAPLLAAFLVATPLLLPDARAAPGPCDGRFGFVDCGCAFGAAPTDVSCGTLEVFCDGLGNGYAVAQGASTSATTLWVLKLSVTGSGYSGASTGTGFAFAGHHRSFPTLLEEADGYTVSAELRADGDLVAAGTMRCA